uniref:Tick transposon n=1 Tax=Rhipicephalus zambeziensis TaxID=60191 RepID=A0A224ZAC4_9ACAR
MPAHVGISGNEQADTLATTAHHPGVPLTRAVAASDFSRQRLRQLLTTLHPDARVANGKGPKPLPEVGLTKRERATLLRLRTGCVWTAARLFSKGRSRSPACERCGDPETLEHLLCGCPGLAQERSKLTTTYRQQGLPATTVDELLFPSPPKLRALQSLLEFVEATGITTFR